MRRCPTYVFLLCLAPCLCLSAQSQFIQWVNPSFEDMPGPGRPPLGWYFCGPPDETPPDVHPVGIMNVTQSARHGKTYAGLVVRDNGTQETLGQSLGEPLLAGQCYFLRFYACRSATFSSYSRSTGEPVDFTPAVRLQIWAGNLHCTPEALLTETEAVRDTNWHAYEVVLRPQQDYEQLFFTAAYADPSTIYNGHVLLDHLSPIVLLDCNREKVPASVAQIESSSGQLSASLSETLRYEIDQVRWARHGFSLYQELFPALEEPGHWITGNPAIYRISHYLKRNPETLLTIAVGPRKDPLISHHIRLLAAEFLAAGLPPEQCLIRPLKKRDRKRSNWLNADTGSSDLLWGISE